MVWTQRKKKQVQLFLIFFLQAKLQEFLGKQELDKHLDADEAIVLGASLHAANLSDGIKLNRKLGMIDGSTYGYFLYLDGPDLVRDETTRQLIVPRMKKLPSKVSNSQFDFVIDVMHEILIIYISLLLRRCSDPLFIAKILMFLLLMKVKLWCLLVLLH